MSRPEEVGVLTVATNQYIEYWEQMALGADKWLFHGSSVTLHVFTDQAERAAAIGSRLDRVQVRPIPIPPLRWPAATIERYRLIKDHSRDVRGELLLHVDADMVFSSPVGPELDPSHWPGGLALVRHPGYFRPMGLARGAFYARHPGTLASDLVLWRTAGGLGAWEDRPASQAFVPRASRRSYLCGGVWFGARDSILRMCSTLADAVEADAEAGLMAVWHDESHLNRYASAHPHAVLGPEYCFVVGYPQLQAHLPRIIAVEKGDRRTR
jgi:hypothetical protein